MSYCTVANVQGQFRNLPLVSSGDGLTSAKVQEFIDLASAHIDGRLCKKYETPITGENSLKVVKRVCVYLAAADVEDTVRQLSGKKDEMDRAKTLREMAESDLKMLESGALTLTDATLADDTRFGSYNVANSIEAKFKKDCKQW